MPMNPLMLALCLVSFSQNAPNGPRETNIPDVLIKAFKHRSAFKTAVLKYRYERETAGRLTWVRNLEASFSNDVLLQKDCGDDEGFLWPPDPDSGQLRIGNPNQCVPEERVLNRAQDELWVRSHGSPVCRKDQASTSWLDYSDVRTFGLRAIEIRGKSPSEYVQTIRQIPASYSVESLGKSMVKVMAASEKGPSGEHAEIIWEIDVEKGPEVVRTQEYYVHPDGKRQLMLESKCVLAQFDGRWWPVEIEGVSVAAGTQARLRFNRVEFDRPEHLQKIGPDDLGIPAGADVIMPGAEDRNHYLPGGMTVDHATWETVKNNYDLAPLAEFRQRAKAIGPGLVPDWWDKSVDSYGLEGVADRPDLWEAYVRRWVIKHTNNGTWRVCEPLTDMQRSAAVGILGDCRKRAVPIRTKLDQERAGVLVEIAALESLDAAAATSAPSNTPGNPALPNPGNGSTVAQSDKRADNVKRIVALRARAATFEKSTEIERLFEELRRRLDGLLTTRQADPSSGRFERPKPPSSSIRRGARQPVRPATPTSRPVTPGR